LKNNISGFENVQIEQTPVHLQTRDTHRIIGEYVLTEEDMDQGRSFDDAIAVGNRSPDIWGPDYEHQLIFDNPLWDIPYRCLVPKKIDNLLAAGMIISTDFIVQNAIRHASTSLTTGQRAGTAAALSVKNRVTPRELDVGLLQRTLRGQGVKTSIKDVPRNVVEEYRRRAEKALSIDLCYDKSDL
jgi:hypothetical protein